MEQRHKVRLTTSNTFVLEREEIKRLYTYLSLFQYRYLRIPDYRENLLFESLEKDFRKFYIEMQTQTQRDPNNLTLNRICAFFDNHYKHIKEINKECENSENKSKV
ncbi:MAG: hypothetical protein SNI49_03215 [Rikenellaceae bacterium]